jgi:hypothetical protein
VGSRVAFATAATALAVVPACGWGGGSGGENRVAAPRVERCVDRFVERARPEGQTDEGRRYVEKTYCRPFDRRGWVHEDGTLAIDAHVALTKGGSCATAEAGQPAETVPCDQLHQLEDVVTLDCAVLHLVRREDVRRYIDKLKRTRRVACDDGTPLDKLGVE